MARIEWTCPITGEVKAQKFLAGENPTLSYGAAASKEEIDKWEKANPKAIHFARQAHQR